MNISEKVLNKAFVEKAEQSPEFIAWLLSHTKFKERVARLVLARGDNPWYRSEKTGKDSETDILLVFSAQDGGTRFALHIENKTPSTKKFRPDQPENYRIRASDWVGSAKWGNYQDFEVGLIAPTSFADTNILQAQLFNWFISYDALAEWIPEFAA